MNVKEPANKVLLGNVVWSISNLCRGKPSPEFGLVKDCIPAMPFVISHPLATEQTKTDALWILSYISDGEHDNIQGVVEAGVIPHAIAALRTDKSSIILPAMRVLGNIVTGSTAQTQAVLDAGILGLIMPMLQHRRVSVSFHDYCRNYKGMHVSSFVSCRSPEGRPEGNSLVAFEYCSRIRRSDLSDFQVSQNSRGYRWNVSQLYVGGSERGRLGGVQFDDWRDTTASVHYGRA